MYIADIDSVFGSGAPKLDAALKEALAAKLQVRFYTELMPALRTAARAYLAYVLAGIRASQVRADLAAAGLVCPYPQVLLLDPDGLPAMVRAMIDAELIDEHDSLLAGVPVAPKTE